VILQSRTDRRDYLTLLSDFGRLKFTLLHGVTGEETAKSPVILKNTGLRPAELGCWRSHVNAWQRIVESRIATALILEDDADWHVDIKGQMALLSKALLSGKNPFPKEFRRFEVGNTTRLADPSFPYGTVTLV
jgi:GR25 family glycosyltransferase involved in LPS biosynthesis